MWNREHFNVRFLLVVVLSIVFLVQSNIAFAWPWTSKEAKVQERKANRDSMIGEEKAARKTRVQERKANKGRREGRRSGE